jgi:VWFA-related protein
MPSWNQTHRSTEWVFFRRKCFLHGFIFVGLPALLLTVHARPPQNQDFTIKIGVEEVRVDATVLDKKGRQVTDLTTNDFEIYQDGKKQEISSAVYISNSPKGLKSITPKGSVAAEPLLSVPMLLKDEVNRTIAFLYNRNYEARISMQKFVESQMEIGDLVSIIGDNSGVAALQKFSSDKRELLARIKRLPISIDPTRDECWRGSYGFTSVIDASLSNEQRQQIEKRNRSLDLSALFDSLMYSSDYPQILRMRMASIRYGIRALQDMPGRKYLILMSDNIFYDAHKSPAALERILNETANEALRAGVVIFTLDTKGLSATCQKISPLEQHLPLSKKTGGLLIENSNFFREGIKPVQEMMSGYYLLSYIPAAGSIDGKPKSAYHRIRVKVNKSGYTVHTRDGFFDDKNSSNFTEVSPANSLHQAIFSPFRYNDLELHMISGYAVIPMSGYFLRTWIHLNGNELTFMEEKNGTYALSLELETLTSDANGMIPDAKATRYDFELSDQDICRIRNEGLDLISYLPVKNPGGYYVRAAVRDIASKKIGSGYQYLEIPDIRKRPLSLASIFFFNNADDISLFQATDMEKLIASANTMNRWKAFRSSPALRSYHPGDAIDYLTILYTSAIKEKKTLPLELQTTLYKDGKIYQLESPEDIRLSDSDALGRLIIRKKLTLPSTLEEGDYLLELTIRDKQSSKNIFKTSQMMDFQVRKETRDSQDVINLNNPSPR